MKLNTISNNAGFSSYEAQHCGNSSEHCARQLAGRSHYYDAETRRYFGARVLDVGTVGDDTILVTIESVAPPSGSRLYRMVAFDCTGTVVFRTEHETDGFNGWNSAAAARRELRDWRAACDPVAILRDALKRKQKYASETASKLSAAIEALADRVTL